MPGEFGHLRTTSIERSQRFACHFVFHQLQDAEKSLVANVAHAAILFLDGFQARGEIAALPFDIDKDFFFFVDLQVGDRCRATNRMTAISEPAPKHVGFKIFCDCIGNDHRTKREIAACQPLGAGHNVRANSVMLRSQPFAGAAKTPHYFVGDQQDAVFVAEGAELRIVIVGRNKQTVRTGDAFDQDCCNAVRTFHLDDFFDMRNTFAVAGFDFLPEWAAIAVRVENPDDSRKARLDRPAPRVSGSAHRTHGGAVIGTIASDDFVSAANQSSHLHGVFVCFGAAQCEKFFSQTRDFRQFPAELAARLGRKARSCKTQLIDLLFDRCQHFWMLMTHVQIDELRTEIQPAIVIAIPEPDALASLHVNGIRGRLNRPREHGVVAIFLHHFERMRVHTSVSLNHRNHTIVQRCLTIQSIVLDARRSSTTTDISRCSSLVSSILLWLIPPRDCTNIITVGIPARATSAASCNGPDGMEWEVPAVSRIASSHNLRHCGSNGTGSIFHNRDQSTVHFSSSANRWLASCASRYIRARTAASRSRWSKVTSQRPTTAVTIPGKVFTLPMVQTASWCFLAILRISRASLAAAASASRRAFIGVEPECASCP